MTVSYQIHPTASTRATNSASRYFQRVSIKFNNRFDYSKAKYKTSGKDKIIVICPDHGEFSITPNNHENSQHGGCPQCSREQIRDKLAHDTEWFINKAKTIYHDQYTYNETHYINMNTPVIITCNTHGTFQTTPTNFLNGYGCNACKGYADSQTAFIEKANIIHDCKYDYSKTVWINSVSPVTIICPIHGEFEQTPANHCNNKAGCKKCSGFMIEDTNTFIEKAQQKHGDRYDYSKSNYIKHNEPVTIICPIHGEFEQTPNTHCSNRDVVGCPRCAKRTPKWEDELASYLDDWKISYQRHDQSILPGRSELDFYIPEFNLAIELCGLYWHSHSIKSDTRYHYNKWNECQKQDIRLITIFEDEWIHQKKVCLSHIKNALGNSVKGTYGRKLIVKEIEVQDSKPFLNIHHPQGFVACKTYIGAFDNDELVGVMGFGSPTRQQSSGIELKRFSSDGKTYPGMAGKLFAYFVRNYNPTRIISFSDNRWFTGNMYERLGFYKEEVLPPDYTYFLGTNRYHKSGFRKDAIKKKFPELYDSSLTEREMMEQTSYGRIYDCGKIRWIWEP